jgi:hypothetical protein
MPLHMGVAAAAAYGSGRWISVQGSCCRAPPSVVLMSMNQARLSHQPACTPLSVVDVQAEAFTPLEATFSSGGAR